MIGAEKEEKKKKTKKGFYFSAQCGFECGKNNEVMEPVPLSQVRSSPSVLSRSSSLRLSGKEKRVSEKDKKMLDALNLSRSSKQLPMKLPEPTVPSSAQPQFAEKNKVNSNSGPSKQTFSNGSPYASVNQQSEVMSVLPRKQTTSFFKQGETPVFQSEKGNSHQVATASQKPIPPLPPLPPSATKSNAQKSHKLAANRFRDPSSIVTQRVQEVEDRIKTNENPLLVPVPVDPPSIKMQLDRPKPNHFDVPRVPDKNGRIL